MNPKIKETEYFPTEWAYNCPHCNHTQGWTDYLEDMSEEEWTETHNCDKCNKEYRIKRPIAKQKKYQLLNDTLEPVNIFIDESAKADFINMCGWSEEEFKQFTKEVLA